MNDLTLQKARAYEAEHGAAISPAERPAYHMFMESSKGKNSYA